MNEAPYEQPRRHPQAGATGPVVEQPVSAPAHPLYASADQPQTDDHPAAPTFRLPNRAALRATLAQRLTFSERPTWSLLFSLVALLLLGLIGVLIISSSAGGANARLRAAATRTAALLKNQGTAQTQAIYFTILPGAGCDKNGALWATDNVGSFQCVANGLQITNSSTNATVSTAWFQGVKGYFPTNYRLSVDIDTSNLGANGCAGIEIRSYGNSGGYGFYVCPGQGFWRLNSYDSQTGTATKLQSSSLGAQTLYEIMAIANGNTETYYIDGNQVATATSSAATYNKSLGLNVDVGQGSNGSAIFTDFTLVTL